MDGPDAEVLRLVAEAARLVVADLTLRPASDIGSTNRSWIVTDSDDRYADGPLGQQPECSGERRGVPA